MAKITQAIHELGPLIQCALSASSEREKILKIEGKPIPARLHDLIALIDTGSDSVLIDSKHIALLQLPVRSLIKKAGTVDGESKRYRTKCEIGLIIPLDDKKVRWDGSAYCDDGLAENCEFDMIIGRSVLSALNLHYDGPNCIFTISHG
jgi:hypothetical protein